MTNGFNRESSFGWLIAVLSNYGTKVLDAELNKHGLTIALWPTMMCLWEEEGVTQTTLAEKAKVRNSTTTRTLDKLEALGLVERRADPNSRRSFLVFLTDEGRAMKELVLPIPARLNKEFLGNLSEEESAELIRLLQKLVKAAH
ncbi:MAG: MarR family winged helix-turn-helix transcriptional regulator [Psychrobium sp.]